ncbi:MAG: ribosomal RNA small subunit methyltransferase A [Candidatus Pelagibacter sp. TMED196]|nr:MAG: ribosomal RNA small subunit methyltransferase A [Candidatus Pelagibacter sp. TMED196]|tara:strand:+ start:1795 stop:2583 length:789 start_codon:yes stop_codon:yes gene_type:complete
MFKLKKSLGQNLLTDKNIINKILSIENLKNQNIMEIGPGSGNLTKFIVQKEINNLLAVEKDVRFAEKLKKDYIGNKKIYIENKDILKKDLNNISFEDVIVFGNLPYNISTQILVNFININKWPPFYKKIIFMFQKEVADRILAKSKTKQYGRLAILTRYRLDIIQSFSVSKNCFFPIPAIDSKIVVFKPKKDNKYKIKNIKNLEFITNIFFNNKRKMINKPFEKLFKNYIFVAKKLNIDLNLRPSDLSIDQYYKLVEYYEKN